MKKIVLVAILVLTLSLIAGLGTANAISDPRDTVVPVAAADCTGAPIHLSWADESGGEVNMVLRCSFPGGALEKISIGTPEGL